MAGAATRSTKKKAQRLYEEEGLTYAAIGRQVKFGPAAVTTWAKDGGWVKAGTHAVSDRAAELDTVASAQVVSGGPPPDGHPFRLKQPEGSEAELRERIATLEAHNKQLEEENYELKPTHDLEGMFTDRVEWLEENSPQGKNYWVALAEAEYKKVNKERALEGLPGFDIKQHPEILDDLIIELKTKESTHIDNSAVEPAARKIKLAFKRNDAWMIEQIPFENQINNTAGSLADGIIRYTQKGFKLTNPFLCPRAGCFYPAAVDEMKRWQHDGYCTEVHRAEVEGKEKSPTAGLQTMDVLSGIT